MTMESEMIFRNEPPKMLPLYAKALKPKKPESKSPTIPELKAELIGVDTDTSDLKTYMKVCGFQPALALPMTWPHILAFPLHMKLMTDDRFPLPAMGLVHMGNKITQYRAIGLGERLDLLVRFANQTQTDRGIEFDIATEAHVNGKLVWEEASTFLFRQSSGASKSSGEKKIPELPKYTQYAAIKAKEDLGRRYGKVSGDLNPIHMHPLTAKAFGFPKNIAHGMWSQANAIARLSQSKHWKDGKVTVTCSFKKPLLLPGSAQLNWEEEGSTWPYQILNARGDAPHLSGEVIFG